MRSLHVAVFVLAAGFLAGCSTADVPVETGEAPENATAGGLEQEAPHEMEVAIEEIRSAIEDFRLKVYQLHETFAGLQAATQAEYAESIERLGESLREADEQFTQLRQAGHETWSEDARELNETLDRMDAAYQEIVDALADL